MKRILLVEDEPGLRMTLVDRLSREGYQVETCADGEAGLRAAVEQSFDLVILDLMLPLKSGLDVCRELRQAGRSTPVLMLTARGQLSDKLAGFQTGADDYLTKPFEMMELLARLDALSRRASGPAAPQESSYRFGRVHVDFRSTEVALAGRKIALSAMEFHLLRYFIEHRGETLSREKLLHEVWGYDSPPQTRTVDVHVAWLRQKLEDDPRQPRWIVTVHRFGYRFTG
jgi:two-component system alkaline phosphatase synthesis response regulator PhoP